MTISEKDKQYIWHPYTQMQDARDNIAIVKADGAHLYDENGNKYIDGISSWWVNTHGHSHPYIADKVHKQLKVMAHVIFAGFTHAPATELAERIIYHLPENQAKVFFSDNGSTAVEVALKMAFQYWFNIGEKRTKVIALKGSYHGDTFGAMSVSSRSPFTDPFNPFLFDVDYLDFPTGKNDDKILKQLSQYLETGNCASFIFEPLVQGAAGMKIYSPVILGKMIELCKKHKVICIADEVFTGFGRTGRFFAMDHVSEKADIFCLSKGLTGGTMAFGLTTCNDDIFNAFLSNSAMKGDGEKIKTFFHGHSYTANPIACVTALASLDLMERRETFENISRIAAMHEKFARERAYSLFVSEVRYIGTILAIEFHTDESTGYFNLLRERLYNHFLSRGILLRPLGNVIYVVPPYCISNRDLEKIYKAITEFDPTLAD